MSTALEDIYFSRPQTYINVCLSGFAFNQVKTYFKTKTVNGNNISLTGGTSFKLALTHSLRTKSIIPVPEKLKSFKLFYFTDLTKTILTLPISLKGLLINWL